MLKYYIKIALRNLFRHKSNSAINILGLAVGMGICLVIFQYLIHESGYDDFHHNSPNTYRLVHTDYKNIGNSSVFGTYGIGTKAREIFPEVLDYTRIHPFNMGMVISNPEKVTSFFEENILYTDSSFLDIFNFPLKYGAHEKLLSQKHSTVITASIAEKYFGNIDPTGKTIRINSGVLGGDFTVSGVLEDLPVNTHLQFDFLLPLQVLLENYGQYKEDDGWLWDDFVTYISVDERADISTLQNKIQAMIHAHGEEDEENIGVVGLQKVEDIHLHSSFSREMAANNGRYQDVQFITIIAIFILLMAWLNYINLSTAHAINRAKEIGIKKTIGALRTQIVWQIIVESALVNVIAAMVAVFLAKLSMPILSHIVGYDITFNLLLNTTYLGYFIGIVLLGTLISGFYPAVIMSSYKPVSIFNTGKTSYQNGFSLRKGLIVFQFAISALLISGTYLVYQQISFMRNQEMGYDIEQVMVIQGPRLVIESVMEGNDISLSSKYDEFRNSAISHHAISAVTASSSVPGKGYSFGGEIGTPGETKKVSADFIIADTAFLEAYGLELLVSLPIPQQIPDWTYVLINEETLKALGIEEAEDVLGSELEFFDYTVQVLGVVKNIYWNSLKELQSPTVFILDNDYGAYLSVKVNPADIATSIAHLETSFKATFPGDPFEYFFLDDSFNRQYQSDLRFRQLFTVFSSIAILIACIGLFALVSHATALRTKEIGIRKVMGASVPNVVKLLSLEYLILIIVGIGIAAPVTYYGAGLWLENYAYQIQFGVGMIIIPAGLILTISLLTVSFKSVKAALANPVGSLRNE